MLWQPTRTTLSLWYEKNYKFSPSKYTINSCNIDCGIQVKLIFQLKCNNFKDINEWKQDLNPVRYKSKQTNGFDCGIHAAIVMEKLVLDPSATIDQKESQIIEYRKQLCLRMLDFSDSQ